MVRNNTLSSMSALDNCGGGEADCFRFSQVMDDVLDGEAAADESSFCMKHLEDCSTCSEEYKKHNFVKKILKDQVQHVAVPGKLLDSIRGRIRETL